MHTHDILRRLHEGDPRSIGRAISLVENHDACADDIMQGLDKDRIAASLIIGITGPPGAGKSTLTAQLIQHLRKQNQRVGIIAIDPSSPLTGGALLGDRIRMMQHSLDKDVVVRSMATRGKLGGLSAAAGAAVRILAASGCHTVIIETVGIGQSEIDIIRLADISTMVLAPGFGDDIQAMKAGIMEVADIIVANKCDQPGADKLLMDLGNVFESTEERNLRIVQTTATEDSGLDVLVDRIQDMEKKYRHDGTLQKKRLQSTAVETLDWAIEILRPRIAALVDKQDKTADPRCTAKKIINQLIREKD